MNESIDYRYRHPGPLPYEPVPPEDDQYVLADEEIGQVRAAEGYSIEEEIRQARETGSITTVEPAISGHHAESTIDQEAWHQAQGDLVLYDRLRGVKLIEKQLMQDPDNTDLRETLAKMQQAISEWQTKRQTPPKS